MVFSTFYVEQIFKWKISGLLTVANVIAAFDVLLHLTRVHLAIVCRISDVSRFVVDILGLICCYTRYYYYSWYLSEATDSMFLSFKQYFCSTLPHSKWKFILRKCDEMYVCIHCDYANTLTLTHLFVAFWFDSDIHEFGTNWMNVIKLPTWFEWSTQYAFILITYKLVEYVWGRPNVSYVDYWLGHTAAISNISHSLRLFTLLCLLLNIHAILVYALFVHVHSAQLMQRSSKATS